MKYISTRNSSKTFEFKDVFIKGLADDGGLFIPKSFNKFSKSDIDEFKDLNYQELAKKIIYPFIGNFMNENDLSKIIDKSYSVFRKKNVVDLVKVGDRSVLELFHGPTLAFKDVAMQLLGNFYEYYLNNENEKLNIVVATSGDTGAAAIDAIKGKKNINIFVLHPHNRVSPVQRKLMTTGKEQNVFNIAINGSFDDCQNLVKLMFADKNFSQDIKMSGVNSINWARIIAQSVYYFYSYFLVEDNKQPINFSVPTGNFGDVYAGYLAKKMGLPINKLIVATNQNDILHRAISKGSYEVEKVHETISPSMDIQIASNFERLLYDLNDGDDIQTAEVMKNIKENGKYIIDQKKSNIINNNFLSSRMSEEEVLKTINTVYEKYSIVLDPHSAIGYGAFDKINLNGNNIVLATAHPCKFPDAIKKAINLKADLPEELMFVLNEEEKFDIIDNDVDKVKKHIKERIQ
jgi:threonine synthase